MSRQTRRAVDSLAVANPASEADAATVRVRIDLAYDGTAFAGWATQPGLRTVQGEIESGLATLVTRDGEDAPRVVVAGRTDAGVHATGQVLHVDLDADRFAAFARPDRGVAAGRVQLGAAETLARRLGGLVGRDGDIVVHRASIAPAGFDARFSALWRRYEYRIADGRSPRDPRRRHHTLFVRDTLDIDAMNRAADALVGLRDFGAFCKPRDGATTVRTLQSYAWRESADGTLVATVRADAFCHSMVRSLVGAAIAVGRGALDLDTLVATRDAAARTSVFPVVAPHGLTLVEVGYPPEDELAARADQTRAKREIADGAPLP